ncbi:MAG: hypothetical protein E7179_01045 [Erysipelotrichaceae bacterium]|jgi:hypothetical protein|nr:hypothetical protein [Erysipelotrichaceae bacterium]
MKKPAPSISNPDELNKRLQRTSPVAWVSLAVCVLAMAGFLAWSFLYRFQERIVGSAHIDNGQATLVVDASKKNKLAVGQKVYIAEQVGEIVSLNNDNLVVSSFSLPNGDYTYTIVREVRPVDFLIGG